MQDWRSIQEKWKFYCSLEVEIGRKNWKYFINQLIFLSYVYLLVKYKISLFIFPYINKFFSHENSPGHNGFFLLLSHLVHKCEKNQSTAYHIFTLCHWHNYWWISSSRYTESEIPFFQSIIGDFPVSSSCLSVDIVFLITIRVSVSFNWIIQFCGLILLG